MLRVSMTIYLRISYNIVVVRKLKCSFLYIMMDFTLNNWNYDKNLTDSLLVIVWNFTFDTKLANELLDCHHSSFQPYSIVVPEIIYVTGYSVRCETNGICSRLFIIATVMSTLLLVSNLNISNGQTKDEASPSEETNLVQMWRSCRSNKRYHPALVD